MMDDVIVWFGEGERREGEGISWGGGLVLVMSVKCDDRKDERKVRDRDEGERGRES